MWEGRFLVRRLEGLWKAEARIEGSLSPAQQRVHTLPVCLWVASEVTTVLRLSPRQLHHLTAPSTKCGCQAVHPDGVGDGVIPAVREEAGALASQGTASQSLPHVRPLRLKQLKRAEIQGARHQRACSVAWPCSGASQHPRSCVTCEVHGPTVKPLPAHALRAQRVLGGRSCAVGIAALIAGGGGLCAGSLGG